MQQLLQTIDLNATDKQLQQLETYYNLLIEYNNNINLTAITNRSEVYVFHFLDSLLPHKLLSQNANVIDIGTGAGFPSIPLKIMRPDLNFFLVDSLNKRVNFLNAVISALQLENITAVHSRAEDLKCKEKYDYGVARAVSKLPTLCEYILPFIRTGGKMIAYKANDIDIEVSSAKKAIATLGAKLHSVDEMPLPSTDIIRKFVVLEKIQQTPDIYPRGQNKPKDKPI